MPSIFDEIESEATGVSLFDEIEREENERRKAIAGGLETALQGIGVVQATQPFLTAELGEMSKAAAEERRQRDIRRSFSTTPMPGVVMLTPEEAQGASQIIGGGLTQAGRNVRDTLAAGGYLATGDQPAALQQIVAPEAEKPLAEDIERLPLVPELAAKGAYGLAEAAPRFAGMAAISAVAPPLAPAAGGLMFGFNEQGFSPEEAAIATVIPWVGSRSGGIVAAIAKKFGVESGQALKIWRMAGGTTGAAGYLGVIDSSRIAGLAPEDREQAIKDFVASQMGFAVLGMIGGGHQPEMEAYRTGKRFGPPDPTQQQQEFLRSNLPKTQEPGVPLPQPVGGSSASEISQNATVYGPLRSQPVEGAGQMPIPESRPGVQPQAARGIPEAPQGEVPLEVQFPLKPGAGGRGNVDSLGRPVEVGPDNKWRLSGVEPTPVPVPPTASAAAPAAAPVTPAKPSAKPAPFVSENKLRIYPESDVSPRIEKTRTAPIESFMKEVESSGKSLTYDAWDLGISVRTEEQLDALMTAYQEAGLNFREAMIQKNMKRATAEMFRSHYFREAYEAATGTRSAGLALKDVEGYKPPFPKTGAPEANKPPAPSVELEPPIAEPAAAAPKPTEPAPVAEPVPAAEPWSGNLYYGDLGGKQSGELTGSAFGDYGKGIYVTPNEKFAKEFATGAAFATKPKGSGIVHRVEIDPPKKVFKSDGTPLTPEEIQWWEKEGFEMGDVKTRQDLIEQEGGRQVGAFGHELEMQSGAWDEFLGKFGYDAVWDGDQLMLRSGKARIVKAAEPTPEPPAPAAPAEPVVGMRFLHKRIYDPTKMPDRVPQMFEVSSIRQGRIYYRPIYRYEGGRIEVGKTKDYVSEENWAKVFEREATSDEASYGSMLKPEESATPPAELITAPKEPVAPEAPPVTEAKPAEAAKEPWQMTKAEIVARDKEIWGDQSTEAGQGAMLTAHRKHVIDAIREGKPVPAEVLADYLELAPKPADPTPPVAETKPPTAEPEPPPSPGKWTSATDPANETITEPTPPPRPGEVKPTTTETPTTTEGGGKVYLTVPFQGTGKIIKAISAKAGEAFDVVKEIAKEAFTISKMNDYRRSVLNWSAKMQRSFGEAASAQQEIVKAVPDESHRNGITNWIEAGGDEATLRSRAAATSDPELKAGYEAALNLTPAELQIARDTKAAFDALAQRGQRYGVLGSFKDNYVTHLWNVAGKGLFGASRKLRDKFKFSKARTFDTFFDGEQAGYTPKTKDISKILPVYLHEMNTVIANRQFVEQMSKGVASDGRPLLAPRGIGIQVEGPEGQATLIMPHATKGNTGDYKTMPDQPALNDWRWASKDSAGNPVFMKSDLVVHPEAYGRLKAVLGKSAIREWYGTRTSAAAEIPKILVKGIDAANAETKRTMLGMLATFHQVQEGTHAVGHRINPFFSIPKIDLVNNAEQMDAARHGLMLLPDRASESQFMEGFRTSGVISRIPGLGPAADWYSNYLFHEYIPGLKYKTYSAIFERNKGVYSKQLASGEVKLEDVKTLSAEQANAAFGHLNYADLARDPTIQHIMQIGLLAPDFLEARGRFAGQAITGATGGKVGREQLLALATLAVAQAALSYTSAGLTGGKWDKKHPFEFVLGNRRYTMRSVPEDVMTLARDPRLFIHSRLSPIVGKGTLQGLSGVDWRGRKVTAGETAKELAQQPVPISVRGFLGLGSPSLSGMEQLAGSVGLKISHYSPTRDVNELAGEWMRKSDNPKLVAKYERDQKAEFGESDYFKIRTALGREDYDTALKEYGKLRETKKSADIAEALRPYTMTEGGLLTKPVAGMSRVETQRFLRSLTPEQRKLYEESRAEKRELYQRFLKMLRETPKPATPGITS